MNLYELKWSERLSGRTAVCGSAHGSVHAVRAAVCGSALGSVLYGGARGIVRLYSGSAAVRQQCAAVRHCASVQQCA